MTLVLGIHAILLVSVRFQRRHNRFVFVVIRDRSEIAHFKQLYSLVRIETCCLESNGFMNGLIKF